MQFELTAIVSHGRQRGVHRRAGVDHEQIARREPAREIGEARVLDRIALDVRYEQPDLIALQAARLWRLGGFEIGRKIEVCDHAGCSHGASSACAANRPPLTSSGSWSNSQCQKGTVISGSGRSEMSSSGNAS